YAQLAGSLNTMRSMLTNCPNHAARQVVSSGHRAYTGQCLLDKAGGLQWHTNLDERRWGEAIRPTPINRKLDLNAPPVGAADALISAIAGSVDLVQSIGKRHGRSLTIAAPARRHRGVQLVDYRHAYSRIR